MHSRGLPRFLQPLVGVGAPRRSNRFAAQMGGGAPAPGQKVLANVAMTAQEQSNWCWSSVTQSVQGWVSNSLTQTDIATGHITHNGRAATCAPPHSADYNGQDCAAGNACAAGCNDPHILSVVLTENARFKAYLSNQSAPAFADLTAQINNNCPVPCRVQWNPTGGHFIIVVGWTIDADGAQLVHVLDPARADAGDPIDEVVFSYSDFISAYQLQGVTGRINYSYEVQ
jgi:hypothetical protein